VQRPSSHPGTTTTDSAPPKGEALLSDFVLALARQAAREAFAAATRGSAPSTAHEAGAPPGPS
jgi:hypothetical protein